MNGSARHDVLVLGSANIDITIHVDRLPAVGETLIGGDAALSPGGKGANQAVAAALSGARVAMAGRLGGDAHAASVRAALEDAGVDTAALQALPDRSTGSAVVLVTPDGDNAIVVAPGANHALVPADVDALQGRLGAAGLLLLQMEVPADVVVRAVAVAAAVGTPVVLNCAPAAPLPTEALKGLAALVVNRSEAELLLGGPLEDRAAMRRGVQELLSAGPAAVVLTIGAEGSVVADAEGVVHVAAPRVEVVDTSGAGDAYVGVLAARLSQGRSLREAVGAATLAGAAAVGRHGAQLRRGDGGDGNGGDGNGRYGDGGDGDASQARDTNSDNRSGAQ